MLNITMTPTWRIDATQRGMRRAEGFDRYLFRAGKGPLFICLDRGARVARITSENLARYAAHARENDTGWTRKGASKVEMRVTPDAIGFRSDSGTEVWIGRDDICVLVRSGTIPRIRRSQCAA